MVIDDLHTRFGRSPRVKIAAKQFIERRLGANDLMAIVHTAGASNANQEFTSNKRLLLAAVDKTQRPQARFRDRQPDRRVQPHPRHAPVAAIRSTIRTTPSARSTRAATLDTLQNVADWFGSVRGRRKAILFVSEGIDYDIHDIIPRTGSNHGGASMVLDATRDAIAAATRSNVAIYGIDPRGLTNLGDESIEIQSFPDDTSLGIGPGSLQNELRLSQDSLRTLSEETGGFAVVNQQRLRVGLPAHRRGQQLVLRARLLPARRAARAVSQDRGQVSRPNLDRPRAAGHVTPKKAAAVDRRKSNSPSTPELKEALDSPLPVSGLTMHVFAAPFKGTAPNASVLFGVEMRGRDLQLSQNTKLLLSLHRHRRERQGPRRQHRLADDGERCGRKPRRASSRPACAMLNRVDLPPGKYQFRVAAHDSAGGNVGSVLLDLDVPDFAQGAVQPSAAWR